MSDSEKDSEDRVELGPAALARLTQQIDAMPKPDLYRCLGYKTTVTERDRTGHAERCASTIKGTSVESAFERRERPGVPSTVRRGRRRCTEQRTVDPQPPPLLVPLPPSLQQEKPMSKPTMTTAEAAKLLGVSERCMGLWAKKGTIRPITLGVGRTPSLYDRGEVLKLKASREVGEETPSRKAKRPHAPTPRAKAPRTWGKGRTIEPTAATDGEMGLREDVIMLVRCVARDWMSVEEAWARLTEIAESI